MNPRGPLRQRRLGTLHGAAVLAVVALSACSNNTGAPASQSSSTSSAASTSVETSSGDASVPSAELTVAGHQHKISAAPKCSTSPSQQSATPTQSGTESTSISAEDNSAVFSLSVSNANGATVDSFAVSLKVDDGEYTMPYQPVQSDKQVEVARQGSHYTITGTGTGLAPGQGNRGKLPFEIDVTCP